jgi:hypothetical protein
MVKGKIDHRDRMVVQLTKAQDLHISRMHDKAHIRTIEDHPTREGSVLMVRIKPQEPMARADQQVIGLVAILVRVQDLIVTKVIIKDLRVAKEIAQEVDIIQEAMRALIRMRMISLHMQINLQKEEHSPLEEALQEGAKEKILTKRSSIKKLQRRMTTEEAETG